MGEDCWDWITNTILPSWETYDELADFSKSDYVSPDLMLVWRLGMAVLLMVNCMTTYFDNPEGVYHFIFYFSYWGDVFVMIGIFLSIRAGTFKGQY